MRIPLAVLGAVVAAVSVPAGQSSVLDTPVRGPLVVSALRDNTPCDTWRTVEHIARFAGVPVGFENTTACKPSGRARRAEVDGIVMDGWTPRQAFDHVVTVRPDFAWREIDGVIVMRPVAAWNDPANVLHLPVAAFAVSQAHPHHALHALAGATHPSLLPDHEDVRLSPEGVPLFDPPVAIDRRIDFQFGGGTLVAALHALARRAGANWEIGYWKRPHVILYSSDYDGGATGLTLDYLPAATSGAVR
jgi:hypothetical protein